MNLLEWQQERNRGRTAPLADRMRPERIEEIVGQDHILGPDQPLRRMIASDQLVSMIFFGPPGSGKTTLARVIARTTQRAFVRLSAVTDGVKEIRTAMQEAKDRLHFEQQRTILFIDEIHRFNKGQQDALLPYVEDGTVTLIGATTENPFFEVNKALLSRCQVIELYWLSSESLEKVLDRALSDQERGLGKERMELSREAKDLLLASAGGDARVLLNSLEMIALSSAAPEGEKRFVDADQVRKSLQHRIIKYDKGEEEHYNTISAFIKSVRGSDPDAAIYYLARMLAGGEDPRFIARRLVILASEDIGNAEPLGLIHATSCLQAVSQIGMPEARIILAQTTTFLAGAPKSNASYLAIDEALDFVRTHPPADIPSYLKDAHYLGAAALGRGIGYRYPHDDPSGYVLQKYLPDEIMKRRFYRPKDIGREAKIKGYLDGLRARAMKQDRSGAGEKEPFPSGRSGQQQEEE